jgi:hypothetical protein
MSILYPLEERIFHAMNNILELLQSENVIVQVYIRERQDTTNHPPYFASLQSYKLGYLGGYSVIRV